MAVCDSDRSADDNCGGFAMKVLVACEESQEVCKAFREKGHEAYSCDIVPCRFTDHPEWHIVCDVFEVIDGYTNFYTQDGEIHDEVASGVWDLIIAHPPCTFLTCTGNRWFKDEYGAEAILRKGNRELAVEFFMRFTKVDCRMMAIENPIGCMSTRYRKPDQIIQPYQFGDPARKATCLWLKNLPPLKPTDVVEPDVYYYQAANGKIKSDSKWRMVGINKWNRSEVRSRTFPGVAKAMADQWGIFGEEKEGEEDDRH
jgi:hypothetical protein